MDAVERADESARSVLAVFGGPAHGWVPFTHLGAVARPGSRHPEWHYWWQAHFVDCLVDATRRRSPFVHRALPKRHLRGIWLRNGGTFRNHFYDDMAWLALSAQRAGQRVGALGALLESAVTDDWDGGAYWNAARDFKNTASTGPIALFLARAGDHRRANSLLGWLRDRLLDERTGLLTDGLRLESGAVVHVTHLFTYNQGPALGTLLEIGDRASLEAAARLVDAVGEHLVRPGSRVLVTHGGGDGGLFTGILARYLALAATDHRLPASTRGVAAELVRATADHLWVRRERRGWRGEPVTVFPEGTDGRPIEELVELSTQLQAWLTFEAAAAIR